MNDPVRPPHPDELDPIETASRDEIAALQLTRLRATLQRAYDSVSHYKRCFDEAGVSPTDLKSLDDLAKFPFTVKDDLRLNYPFDMFAVPLEQIIRIHASSGTTGIPTVVGYTRNDLDMWAGLVARCLRAAGVRPGDMVHVAYGYGLFTGGLGLHAGAEKLGCTVIPASGGFTERQVGMIYDFEPRVIAVTPSYMLAIGDEFERLGLDPRRCSLQIGIHGAEPWTEAMRDEIESRFAMQAIDIYGCSEAIGPGVSIECVESKDGLHIWEDHFYPEIIDPGTGAVLSDGEAGELVITSLTKEACPIVRYRTRDLTRLLPGTARSMRRMRRVMGRNDDMLIIRGVNLFPSFIEEIVLEDGRLSPHYYLEVRRPGRLDELTVVVEAKPGAADEETRQAVARDLVGRIRSLIGISSKVTVGEPGSIERSIGKAKRIVDLRPKA
ncbi:MAG: phenylacetate--CoA ligase [Rhodospirillaceae bacterium]|nr:phenylacetate--CoA ligase [Rhodospirillaceae bacterium]